MFENIDCTKKFDKNAVLLEDVKNKTDANNYY